MGQGDCSSSESTNTPGRLQRSQRPDEVVCVQLSKEPDWEDWTGRGLRSHKAVPEVPVLEVTCYTAGDAALIAQ